MNNRRRTIVIALLISTILVGVIAVILAQLIQVNQAPRNSSAFGFGEAVNKEYFDYFEKKFSTIGCYGILSNPRVVAYGTEDIDVLSKYDLVISNLAPKDKNPVNCTVALDAQKSIDLSIYTYSQNSAIDPDAQSLFARVNSNILKVEYQGDLDTGYFFYGIDSSDASSCRLNYFSERNDFEYITLKVNGFSESCKDQMLLAGELSRVLNESVNSLINYLVSEIKDASTGN